VQVSAAKAFLGDEMFASLKANTATKMNSRQSELAGMGKDRGIRYYMEDQFLKHFELPVGAKPEGYAVRDEMDRLLKGTFPSPQERTSSIKGSHTQQWQSMDNFFYRLLSLQGCSYSSSKRGCQLQINGSSIFERLPDGNRLFHADGNYHSEEAGNPMAGVKFQYIPQKVWKTTSLSMATLAWSMYVVRLHLLVHQLLLLVGDWLGFKVQVFKFQVSLTHRHGFQVSSFKFSSSKFHSQAWVSSLHLSYYLLSCWHPSCDHFQVNTFIDAMVAISAVRWFQVTSVLRVLFVHCTSQFECCR
jgi:hypothetical protein